MLLKLKNHAGADFYIEHNAIVAILPRSSPHAQPGSHATDLVVGVNTQVTMKGTPDDVVAAINAAAESLAVEYHVADGLAGARTSAPADEMPAVDRRRGPRGTPRT